MVSIHMNMRILTPHIVVFSCSVILSVFQLSFSIKILSITVILHKLPRNYLVFINMAASAAGIDVQTCSPARHCTNTI